MGKKSTGITIFTPNGCSHVFTVTSLQCRGDGKKREEKKLFVSYVERIKSKW